MKGNFQVFFVAIYNEKVSDLKFLLCTTTPVFKTKLAKFAIRVGSARREFIFGKNCIINEHRAVRIKLV